MTTVMKRQRNAYLFGIAAVMLWSTVASAFKLSLRYLDPAQLLLYSSLVSVFALSLILAFQGKLGAIFTCSKSEYLQSFRLGLINPFLYYLVLFKAYDLLPAQIAQPINYTWALTMTFLSIPLLKQKIGVQEIVAVDSHTGVTDVLVHPTKEWTFQAPKTMRPTRAATAAPAHMGHGSRVTMSSQSSSRQVPRCAPAARRATTSA